MPWQARTSRKAPLPRNWPAIRRAILQRDAYTCTINGPRCTHTATHVDHTDHATGPHDHRPEVLRSACQTCHMQRTQAQATRPALRRTPTKHPGLL